jgi:hypothetical protein
MDTPNLLWEFSKMMVSNNPYAIFLNNNHKPTRLLYLVILHTTYVTNLLELQSMMDPLGHPHVENDMVHNFAHVFFILDHLDLSTIKSQKVKPSSHT